MPLRRETVNKIHLWSTEKMKYIRNNKKWSRACLVRAELKEGLVVRSYKEVKAK